MEEPKNKWPSRIVFVNVIYCLIALGYHYDYDKFMRGIIVQNIVCLLLFLGIDFVTGKLSVKDGDDKK